MHRYERLIRDNYEAFNVLDLETPKTVLSPDVEWLDQLDGVMLHGPDEVAAYWHRRWALMRPRFELLHCEFNQQGEMVVTLVQTLFAANAEMISRGLVRHVYAFENDLVRRMTLLL